jgi:hypothetical protein
MEKSDTQFFSGMEVIDLEGAKVGKLVRYDERLGYLETEGTFSGPRYIPFLAIESLAPDRIRLNVTRDVVTAVYGRMPEVTPELSASGKLTGGATIESGYDPAHHVPLDAEQIQTIKDRIREGVAVFDELDQKLGTVEAYDPATGYMRLRHGALAPKEIFLPVTTVSFLDDDGIHLSMPKDEIAIRYIVVPEVAKDFFAR